MSTEHDAPVEHEHADVTGGWLRPAVFCAIDGLVSNFALLAGVAGGGASRHVIILAGLAGLSAGAFSMAAGEYTSVASQAENAQAEIAKERAELLQNPDGELAELAATFVDRGVEPDLAREVARQIHADPDVAVEVHARDELGVTMNDLPSPLLAAVSSFVSFAVGAIIPVLPFLLGANALLPVVIVSLLGLFGCGAIVTRLTARPWWFGGLRQLILGAVAAGLTYFIGNLVGAGLA